MYSVRHVELSTDLHLQIISPGAPKTRKDRARVGINFPAYQRKKKNGKTREREAGKQKRKRPSIDFKESVSCPSTVVQKAALQKNGLQG